jgi:hypothetical protein
MGYNGINFNRARMAPPQVTVAGGTMRPQAVGAPAMREALMQQAQPQSVAEILSQGMPEMMPDLAGASSTADRKRQIADMLTGRAMGRNATSLGTGLAQLGEAFIARGATKRADKAETERERMVQALTQKAVGGDEASIAMLLGPEAAIGRRDTQRRQGVEDARYADERTYQRGRDATGDTRYVDERDYLRGRDETADERAARLEAEDARRFGLTYGLDQRSVAAAEAKAEAEANATPSVDFGDVKGVRETNEKRFQTFEESQRAYQSMSGLAELGTGAADIALGFAFFKTFDPNSTVREGEFAQAAGAMGLGDRAVSIFARLDKGEQFTPQLRKELVEAAGVAYNNQVADIEGLVQRESEFAGRYGINPSDITRNPVRAPANNKTTPPANVPPPPDGYDDSDVSWADAWAEMTPAERALFAPQSNTFPSRIKF